MFDCRWFMNATKTNEQNSRDLVGRWMTLKWTCKKRNGTQVGYLNWHSVCNTRSHTFCSIVISMQCSLEFAVRVTLFQSKWIRMEHAIFSPAIHLVDLTFVILWIFMLIRNTQLTNIWSFFSSLDYTEWTHFECKTCMFLYWSQWECFIHCMKFLFDPCFGQ